MQKILIPTTSINSQSIAEEVIPNKSLLYNQETEMLYVKYNNELHTVYSPVDNKNIVLTEKDNVSYISLNENPIVKSTTTSPDDKVHVVNNLFLDTITAAQRTIFLLVKVSDDVQEGLYGEIFRLGDSVSESYHIMVSSSSDSKNVLLGSSSTKPATIKEYEYSGSNYYGIEFATDDEADLYFHGVSSLDTLSPPYYKNYRDSMMTEVN